jgi:hypothetical protein
MKIWSWTRVIIVIVIDREIMISAYAFCIVQTLFIITRYSNEDICSSLISSFLVFITILSWTRWHKRIYLIFVVLAPHILNGDFICFTSSLKRSTTDSNQYRLSSLADFSEHLLVFIRSLYEVIIDNIANIILKWNKSKN